MLYGAGFGDDALQIPRHGHVLESVAGLTADFQGHPLELAGNAQLGQEMSGGCDGAGLFEGVLI